MARIHCITEHPLEFVDLHFRGFSDWQIISFASYEPDDLLTPDTELRDHNILTAHVHSDSEIFEGNTPTCAGTTSQRFDSYTVSLEMFSGPVWCY